MVLVSGVDFLRHRKVPFLSELSVRLEKSCISIGNDRVAEAWHIDAIPGAAEYNVTEQYFVLKSCSERASLSVLFDNSLNLPSDTRHSFYRGSIKLRHFYSAAEHSPYESSVLHDFVWFTYQC